MYAFEPSRAVDFEVIPAHADHAEGIARVSVDTWRIVYPGLVPDSVLQSLNYGRVETRRRQWMGQPQTEHWVCAEVLTGEVVAFANGGPCRNGSFGGIGEIYELYVQNGFQGLGLGRRLFDVVRSALARNGMSSLLIWVLSTNPNRAFYEHIGGRFVGRKAVRVGEALLEEDGYRWD